MPYIKISDPNTIDLASWQQVVNVVNQHSDSINTLTNNFGAQITGTVQWDGTEDFAYEYEPASQKMIYGRATIDPGNEDQITTSDSVHYQTINYANPEGGTGSFSASPIITATARFRSTLNDPPSTNNAKVMVTIIAVTKDDFTVRVVNPTGTALNDPYFHINWIAIGPK
jgi:hypothetical protein